MSEIDPELRDKIIETHTLIKRLDIEMTEHKEVMNGRFKSVNGKIDELKKDIKEDIESHDKRITANEGFRNRIVAYGAGAAAMMTVFVQLIELGLKKIGGG